MEEVVKKRMISLPEVKEILSKVNPESMDQIQRWTHDYVSKFSKIEPSAAKKMKQELISQCGLTEEEAVEIVNILSETLEKILKIIDENS